MEPIAELENASVARGGHPVLIDLDLTVHPGDSVGVAGPNGSGKTTLIRAMATLIPLTAGSGNVLGFDIATARHVRGEIGMIGHEPALIPELTLAENLEHITRLRGMDSGRVASALDVVGLTDAAQRRAEVSSFGMKRRVEIAHLLLTKPRLLLLDEAASGLDDSARGLVAALVDSVRGRGGAAVIVSHDRTHLDSLCASVLALQSGRLVAA